MDFPAWFGDVPAGSEHGLAVPGPEPDLAFGDDGVLVLEGVQVRRNEGADGEGVLDDGYRAVGLAAEELELDPDAEQVTDLPVPGLQDRQGGWVAQCRRGGVRVWGSWLASFHRGVLQVLLGWRWPGACAGVGVSGV